MSMDDQKKYCRVHNKLSNRKKLLEEIIEQVSIYESTILVLIAPSST